MKQIIFTILATIGILSAYGQSYLTGPIVLSGHIYGGTTNIGSGGSIIVGNGGKWTFGGNIISVDKGNSNTPTSLGKSEIITFDGTGSYNGAGTTAGSAGFVIDGYAKVSNQLSSFLLPIGSAVAAYPILVPANSNITAAFFDGIGSTQNTPVENNSAAVTEYSPYIDMPSGFPAGSYIFGYPAGFTNSPFSSLLSSGNSSLNGTSSSTTYSLLSNVSTFSNSASTTTATLTASSATQIYFATSLTALPIKLLSFTGTVIGCTAKLIWQSASEINSSYYALEVSSDAVNYIVQGKVASHNISTGAEYKYAYYINSNRNFFRLKMVDKDGKYSYSNIIVLSGAGACSTGAQILIYPNPAINIINVSGLTGGKNIIKIFDFTGKKIMEFISTTSAQQIDISKFNRGIYMLNIENSYGSIQNLQVEKQ